MKLEILNVNQKGDIHIRGAFKQNCVILVCNSGAAEDKEEYNGLSHLAEHIFLKLIARRMGEYGRELDYKGYTDYAFTIYEFFLQSSEDCKLVVEEIKNIIISPYITEEMVLISKDEVCREILENTDKTENSLSINKIISNGEISFLPIGNIDKIMKFSIYSIDRKIVSYAGKCNMVVFESDSKNKTKELEITAARVFNEGRNMDGLNDMITIYIKRDTTLEPSLEIVLDYIILNRLSGKLSVESNMYSKIESAKKFLDCPHQYWKINVSNVRLKKRYDYKKEIIEILKEKAMNNELDENKKKSTDLLRNIDEINEDFVYQNVINHFLYQGELLLLENQRARMADAIIQIPLNKIKWDLEHVITDIFVSLRYGG